jgi:hypothetical protein
VRSTQEAPRRFNIGSGELEARRLSTQVPLKSVNPAAPETSKKNDPVRTSSKRILKQAVVARIAMITYLRDQFIELCFGRMSCRISEHATHQREKSFLVKPLAEKSTLTLSVLCLSHPQRPWVICQ